MHRFKSEKNTLYAILVMNSVRGSPIHAMVDGNGNNCSLAALGKHMLWLIAMVTTVPWLKRDSTHAVVDCNGKNSSVAATGQHPLHG